MRPGSSSFHSHRFFRILPKSRNRRQAGSLGICFSLLLTSCAPVLHEVRSPGGYTGYVMDQRLFDASRSKQMQLLRSAVLLAMVSRMATTTVRDGKDANAFADYLAAASDELNYAAADLYEAEPGETCGLRPDADAAIACHSYYANFEADIPLVEARIVRLMLAALPEGQARKFLNDLKNGNLLGASLTAIRAAADMTSGLHRSAGVYRSGLELLASTACAQGKFNDATDSVWAAVECLGLSHEKFGNSPNELKGEALHLPVKRDAFHALMLIARSSCLRMPISTDSEAEAELKHRKEACESVQFKPAYRPGSVLTDMQEPAEQR